MAIRHAVQPVVPLTRQRGVVAILFAIFLLTILGVLGLAVDLSRMYNRHGELKALADTAALAAARQLTGTAEGVDRALTAAQAAAVALRYDYDRSTVAWSSTALSFSTTPRGPWLDASSARNAPGAIGYARVDTGRIDNLGDMSTFFIRALSQNFVNVSTSAISVAGRATIDVTPLALCAMSTTPAEARGPRQELVQYGFRRGVGYNLMNLNPAGTTPAHFVVNPIDLPGQSANMANTSPAVVGPFACAGVLPMGLIVGGQIKVSYPFPVGALFEHLNSRFDQYNGNHCKPEAAPPDANIKPFPYTGVTWMNTVVPGSQTAAPIQQANALRTIADTTPSGADTAQYGLLWSFARPAPFSAYQAGVAEPYAGYAPFAKADWKSLYFPGSPEPKAAYPASAPYDSRLALYNTPPALVHGRGVPRRRVLNLPLLACPAGNGTDINATVLAIGRFFMTVPATASTIHAEFAGIAAGETLGGSVELY